MSEAVSSSTAFELLRRSLDRGRLGHAYLFVGDTSGILEEAALAFARTLLCTDPVSSPAAGPGWEACGRCSTCHRVTTYNHPDVTWIRPGKKSRIISVDQIRDLIHVAQVRPSVARYKIGILSGAERLRIEAANAFLKTLEEPPPDSIFILLTTDADRLLETILSRCLRLSFASGMIHLDEAVATWLEEMARGLTEASPTLLQRYLLLQSLLTALGTARERIEESLTAVSPLRRFPDAESDQKDRWEDELDAAIEAEYRRRRGEFLAGFHAWLRDLWIQTLGNGGEVLLPRLGQASELIGRRLSSPSARANLDHWERTQRLLFSTNAQEALVLEVGLLKLSL